MKFQITRKHIEQGKAGDCELCPVALAIQEKFPSAHVLVSPSKIYIDKEWYLTTPGLRNWIERFDEGLFPVGPIAFELSIKEHQP